MPCDGSVSGCAQRIHRGCRSNRYSELQAHMDAGLWFAPVYHHSNGYCPGCSKRCVDFLVGKGWPNCRDLDWSVHRPEKEWGPHANYSPTDTGYSSTHSNKGLAVVLHADAAHQQWRLEALHRGEGDGDGAINCCISQSQKVEYMVEYGRFDWSQGGRLSLCRAPDPYAYPDVPAGHPLRAIYEKGQDYTRRCNVLLGYAPDAHLN